MNNPSCFMFTWPKLTDNEILLIRSFLEELSIAFNAQYACQIQKYLTSDCPEESIEFDDPPF